MAVFKSLTFDGENSLDYGIYITGEAVYNAPERAVDMVTIPGRNGSLAIDQGRFENIEITYPAGAFGSTQTEYSSVMRAFRNFLASRYRYVRLEDDYHPDEYRLGLFKSGLEVDPVSMSRAGEFDIVFDCKPQRFLKSGEVPVSSADWTNVQTASGAVVTIDNSGNPLGIKSLIASIEPVQSGSGTPSPDNICPISGHDSVVVNRTGINVWDEEWEVGALNTDTGATAYSANRIRAKNFIPCLPNTTYSFYYPQRASVPSGNIRVFFYDENETFISYENWKVDGTFTTPNGTRYMKFYTNGSYGETYQNDISINYPSTDTDYHTYEGQTYTTDLGRTVYGGTLDVTTGLLTVDWGKIALSERTWSYNSGGYFYSSIPLKIKGNGNLICDSYFTTEKTSVSTMEDGSIKGNANTANVYIKDSRYTDVTSFVNAMGDVEIAYELATPQTYQLTAQDIDLILGRVNYVSASSGDITVEYGVSPFTNPTLFSSKPLIKVTGVGTLQVGTTTITITGVASQVIYIDCESMEIYKYVDGSMQSAADLVTFSTNEFPELTAGGNTVTAGSGITSVEITPRWWRI